MKRLSFTSLTGADLVDVRRAVKLHKHMTPWGYGYRVHMRGKLGSSWVKENIGFAVKVGDNWFAISAFNIVLSTAKSRSAAVMAVVLHFVGIKIKEGAA